MRVLFHAPGVFVPDGVYGGAVTLRLLRRQLARDGHVSILLAHDDDSPTLGPDGGTTAEGMTLRRSDPAAALPQAARDSAADAVVLMDVREVAAALQSCRNARLPAAVYVHNVDMPQFDAALGDPAVLHLTVSRFAADRLRAWHGIAAEIVPPIIEPGDDRADAPRDRVLFINPVPEKGCEIAFAIMGALRHIPFIVLESWPLSETWRAHCVARIAGFGNVDWRAPTGDMDAVWHRTRALLMPSVVEETWGRAAGEAQAHGIPVIASARGALPETVGAGGLLLDVHGPLDAWLGAVERLTRDDALHRRLAQAARAHARDAHAQPQAAARRLIAALEAHIARSAG